MHPSLAARYKLRTAEDIGLAERFLSAAQKAGWSEAQSHGLLQFYSTLAPALEGGKIAPDDAIHQLWDHAALQGIGEELRAPLIDWHETTTAYLDRHGELPPMQRPSAETIRAERAEIERIMREDPDRYNRDETLKNKYYDLIQQSHGEIKPLATAAPQHLKRLEELKSQMGNYNSEYWSPATGEARQAEFRNLLNLSAPDTGAASPTGSDAGTTTEGT